MRKNSTYAGHIYIYKVYDLKTKQIRWKLKKNGNPSFDLYLYKYGR